MLNLIIKLILAHLIGDFVFQPKKWVNSKEKLKYKSKYLYFHILVHLVSLAIVLQFNTKYIYAIGIIVLSHFIIDLTKLYMSSIYETYKRTLFFIDQLLHLTVIVLIVNYYYPATELLSIFFATKTLLTISFLLFTTFAVNIILIVALSKWNMFGTKDENKDEESLENAGKYIGMLERLFIFFLVVFNYPIGIGFLVTAKSVFRFNDLTRAKDRKLTEYVLIGSMLSFGLALMSGLTYKYLLQLI